MENIFSQTDGVSDKKGSHHVLWRLTIEKSVSHSSRCTITEN